MKFQINSSYCSEIIACSLDLDRVKHLSDHLIVFFHYCFAVLFLCGPLFPTLKFGFYCVL